MAIRQGPKEEGRKPAEAWARAQATRWVAVVEKAVDPVVEGVGQLAPATVEAESRSLNNKERRITMPAGDGTGPGGMGPMTGRGAGYCAGYNTPGYANPAFGWGRGFGRGRGFARGRGWGRGFGRGPYPYAVPNAVPYNAPAYNPPSKEEEVGTLKDQQTYLENALKDVQKQIEDLESQE